MIKRVPSRNQRSKGIRLKHVLQICLLFGVCFWLIYQVKHSHDKKKEFDDKDAKVLIKAHSDDEILKLGRKDFPQVREADKNERHEDEEEDAVVEEENKHEEEEKKVREREEKERDDVEGQEEANKHDEEEEHEDGENKHEDEEQEEENKNEEEPEEASSKHEEDEQEEESRNEETEDERREGGDDELDERDQERTEGKADHEDEFIDEEKEREGEGDDREIEGNDGEEKNGQVENENLLDGRDHKGIDRNTHVAREEHYTADDASSAVSHDNQIIMSETEKTTSENSNKNFERNVLEEENKSNTTDEISGNQKHMELKLGESEMAESGSTSNASGSTSNATTTEEKDPEAGSNNSQEHPPLTANNTSTEEGTGIRNTSTGLSTELTGFSLQNGTETKLDANPTPAQNVTLDGATNRESTDLQTTRLEQTNYSDAASNGSQFDSNTIISTKTVDADGGTGDSFNNSSPALSETFIKLNATADREVNSGSSYSMETADTTLNETSNSKSELGDTTLNETSNSKSELGGTIENSDPSTTVGTLVANSDSESGETNENLDSTNEIAEAAKVDLIDSSDSSIRQDEKESRIDLGSLPDIRAEMANREKAAAE